VNDFNNSIIGNPANWKTPDDVARRDSEMREGIERARQQRIAEESRARSFAQSLIGKETPQPTKPDNEHGFAERYALHVDTTSGDYFLQPNPNGEVQIVMNELRQYAIAHDPGSNAGYCSPPEGFGQDDDFGS
jgi:hypothetical protein